MKVKTSFNQPPKSSNLAIDIMIEFEPSALLEK
jgi:hypothetical protein